jgi:SAM-dependent methyltransferase
MSAAAADIELACPVCGEAAAELYLEDEDRALAPGAIGSSRQFLSPGRILRCRSCQFGFRQLRSSADELLDLYRRMDTRVYDAEVEGRNRTARRHLGIVERYAARGRILDIGCASGFFLSHAADAGWDVTGIEPNESLCEVARKKLASHGEVHCAALENAQLDGGYDVITLWDVLEHVTDPLAFLRTCRQLLAPGGHLFLNVPDLDSLEARLLGRRWPLLLPEHLNYFNRSSLRRCGERAGLTLVRFGRRRVFFSLRYVGYRLGQHGVPGAGLLQKAATTALGRLLIPVSLGETFGVWRRPDAES